MKARLDEATLARKIASTRAPGRSDLESLSPYLERPSIPEGMTVEEYRRVRLPQTKPRLDHLRAWLRQPTRHTAGA